MIVPLLLLSALCSTAAPHAVTTAATAERPVPHTVATPSAPAEHTACSAAQSSAPATPLAAAQSAPTGSSSTLPDSAAIYSATLDDTWDAHEWQPAPSAPDSVMRLLPPPPPGAAPAERLHRLTRTLTLVHSGALGLQLLPPHRGGDAMIVRGVELRTPTDSLVTALYPVAPAPPEGYRLRTARAGAYVLTIYGEAVNGTPGAAPTAVRYTLTAPDPSAVAAPHRQPVPTAFGTATYDLSGRRVSATAPHGLLIRGGRKMMR